MTQKRETILIALVVLVGIPGVMFLHSLRNRDGPRTQLAVSAEQIRRIGAAVGEFEKAKGMRPWALQDMADAGMLDARDLYDKRRRRPPENPDVLYLSALRSSDPAELVLLCTIASPIPDQKLHAVYNDGAYAALTPHEMVMALNRTYTYLGEQLEQSGSATTTEPEPR